MNMQTVTIVCLLVLLTLFVCLYWSAVNRCEEAIALSDQWKKAAEDWRAEAERRLEISLRWEKVAEKLQKFIARN